MKYRGYLHIVHLLVAVAQKLPFKTAVALVFALRKVTPKSSRATWLIDSTAYSCLKKALMVVLVAHERPQVYFGVRKNEEDVVEAHAWTKLGDRYVTGAEGHETFKVIAVF